jgi:large subunit ribosomal protein L4
MASIERIDENGAALGRQDVAAGLVQDGVNIGLLHQVVTSELAGHRQGTAAAKSRSQVAGTTAKQFRQKGTGRARAGSAKVPNWIGGGVAFPPIPRSYAAKINKKVKAQAFRMALGDLVAGDTVRVLSGVAFDEPSTKRAAAIVERSGLARPLLVLVGTDELEAYKSFRNLPDTRTLVVGDAEVQDYVWARSVLFTEAAMAFLAEGIGGEEPAAKAPAQAPKAAAAKAAPASKPALKPAAQAPAATPAKKAPVKRAAVKEATPEADTAAKPAAKSAAASKPAAKAAPAEVPAGADPAAPKKTTRKSATKEVDAAAQADAAPAAKPAAAAKIAPASAPKRAKGEA